MSVQCGNPKHPAGPWHEAAPIPLSSNLIERFRQWRNRKRWGCTCHWLRAELEGGDRG